MRNVLDRLTTSDPPAARVGRKAIERSLPALIEAVLLLFTIVPHALSQSSDESGDMVIDEAIQIEADGNAAAAKSQSRIDGIANETDRLDTSYRGVLEEIDGLRTYNRQLGRLLAAQEAEMTSLREQIQNVTVIGRQMTPLMLRMLDRLEEFIELDVPLHLAERRNRVARLREMMDRADVTNAEKYRRIMEAYQIENEYGRTVEGYQETMEIGGIERTLDFLSFGRVVLIYQSLDAEEAAYWDQGSRAWAPLPKSYRSSVRKGLRMARKQAAPDLVRLPVPAAVEAVR